MKSEDPKALGTSPSNERGMGIVEALFAVAILAVVAISVSLIMVQSKHGTTSLTTDSTCLERANSVLAPFKNHDNGLVVDNFDPYMVGNTRNDVPPGFYGGTTPTTLTFLQDGLKLLPTGTWADSHDDQVNSWILLDNAANWARILYFKNAAYCTAANGVQVNATGGGGVGDFAAGPLAISTSAINNTEKIFLKIMPYDYDSNQVVTPACPAAPIRPIPRGVNPTAGMYAKNYGFQVQATVTYTDADAPTNTLAKTCTAQTLVKPDGDSVAPKGYTVVGTVLDPFPGNCPAGDRCYCTTTVGDATPNALCVASPCINNVGPECVGGFRPIQKPAGKAPMVCTTAPQGADLWISLAVNEPGALFTCQILRGALAFPALNQAALSQMRDCTRVNAGPDKMDVIDTMGKSGGAAMKNVSGIKLQVKQANKGYIYFYFMPVDTAQNAGKAVLPINIYNKATCP